MRKLLLLAVMTCFGMLTSQSAQAQEFVTLNFTAEVTGVSAVGGNIGDQIKESDLVIGQLTFLKDLAPISSDDFSSNFDLNNDANSMSATINGLEFKSAFLEEPTPNTPGFRANMFSWAERMDTVDTCNTSIRWESGNNTFPGDIPSNITSMAISLWSSDCDYELDLDRLPSEIDLGAFDQATLTLRTFDRMNGYAVQAKITSMYTTVEDGGTIKGQVVSDYDGDCELDAEDFGLRQRIVKITPGPYYVATDAEGQYEIGVPVGNYKVHVNERSVWKQSCPTGPADADIVDNGDEVIANFNLEPKSLTEALSVHIMSSLARPGFEMTYTIRIQNTGTLPYNGDVTFVHDALLTDFASEPAADMYADQTATWSLEDFPVDGLVVIKVTLKVPADEQLLGTRICASVNADVDDKGNDEILRESTGEMCQEIRGAYDPNDMQVFVGTANADGEISQDDQVLRYLVRFQNEGNEDAITVRVVDALSEFHNVEKIRLGASSHDYSFNFTDAGELVWTFNDINLPAKSEDEAGSMGYVSFDVHLTGELPIGTEIPNSAAIFFDFNSPIITNTVISRIASSTTSVNYDQDDTSVMVYPNPSTEKVTVRFEEARPAVLTLRNAVGETLLTQTVNGVSHTLNLQSVAAGTYFLTISDSEGITVKPLNVVR